MSDMAIVQPRLDLLKDGNTVLVNRFLIAAIGESCAVVLSSLISKFNYYKSHTPEKVDDGVKSQ